MDVLLAVVFTLAIIGLFQAPIATAAGTTGFGVFSWVARMLGR